MLNDSGDSFGSDSFESLVNFSLIWYTVYDVAQRYHVTIWPSDDRDTFERTTVYFEG